MTGQDPSAPAAPAAAPLAGGGSSSLADGEWHRLHPLTPLFKGGIALIIVAGILLANMRDRIIYGFIRIFAPHELADDEYDYENGDPIGWAIDWTVANNLVIVALLGLLAIVALITGLFWLSWRVHQFRITGEHVEVRKGMIFRTHRRAPLDRVQGVNLTRPFPPRLIGMAKLEVDGAGTDANVPLEYLAVGRAEEVRSDILRLASGARAAKRAAREGRPHPGEGRLQDTVSAGVQELIDGADLNDVVPESVVKLPIGRVIASQLLDAVVWVIFFGGIFLVSLIGLIPVALANEDGEGLLILGVTALSTGVPMVFAVVSVVWSGLSKALRYAIAPTPDGVRVTYGLLTTVTQTIPPGRIHAVEVVQPLLWRPFGWWKIRINRVSGQSAAQQQSGQAQQFNQMLPVGTRDDVMRVLQLVLPFLPAEDLPLVIEHGMAGPVAGADPYRTMARRGRWRRPVSWKRHGGVVSRYALHLRRGTLWRKQAIFPLARLQGVSIAQGPVDRWQRIAWLQAHVVAGAISGQLVGLDREDALALLREVRAGAIAAAAADRTHRWGEHGALPVPAFAPVGAAPGWGGAPAPGGPPAPAPGWGGAVPQGPHAPPPGWPPPGWPPHGAPSQGTPPHGTPPHGTPPPGAHGGGPAHTS